MKPLCQFGHNPTGRATTQSIRLLTSPPGVEGGLPYPPERENRQPCQQLRLQVRGRTIYHAYADERFGQHEAVWQQDGYNLMSIIKPTPWTNLRWFERLLSEIILR